LNQLPVPVRTTDPRLSPTPLFVRRQVRSVDEVTLTNARKIEGAAYVTQKALNHVANLSSLEADLMRAVPNATHRLAALVDSFTAVALPIVQRMAWDDER
jgi:hypothetical protein